MTLNEFYRPLPNIALFAKTRAGKDEIFKILDSMGFDVERVAFGDALKEKFFDTFDWIPKEPKPIAQLIQYGQAMRAINNDVWVIYTMSRMAQRQNQLVKAGLRVPTFVFTDVRQPNEYEACKKAGCLMIRVEAPEEVRVQRMLALGETVSREVLDAPTERALESFKADYVIHNDSTLEQLAQSITEVIFQIQRGRAHE